jgi:trehalose 6-phosphate synthase
VRALPISIDVQAFEEAATVANADEQMARIRARYAPGGGRIGIGVDRIDYSKGLEEKLTALDMLWERHPELREEFTYVQVAVPSRSGIDTYDWLQEKVERMVWSINDRHGTPVWRPVHLIRRPVTAERLALMYRASALCIVSSLQDGMNLVAKEYVASQPPGAAGVLVLSRFAGAAEELEGSVEVNPFDPEEFASRIRDALSFGEDERRTRNESLRASLRTIYDWMVETFRVWGASTHGAPAPLSDADRWKRFR